jgi:hypothetical protein
MSTDDIQTWILPLILIWVMMGLSIGLIGKRNGNTLLKVSFSALFGTGLSPIMVFPLMAMVVLPIGKLADWIGLIDRSTISSDAATTIAIIAMMAIWLIVGTATGSMLLFVTINKPKPADLHRPASGHSL